MIKKIQEQHDSFKFSKENNVLIRNILKKYPSSQSGSAVMPLLDLAMRQCKGWIPESAMKEAAIGAAVGGLIGAAIGDSDTAERIGGAAAVGGAGEGAASAEKRKKRVLHRCMKGRGYRVLG